MVEIGMTIAERYEIVGKVGAGGMSDVYKAKDTILGRFVAIKVLKHEYSEDRTFVTKFRTEAQSAAALEHPNIVNIYDVGSENGLHYIVMEYVEGITLKTYIEKKDQLSFKEAISISIQVARGIEAAHNKHLIHRDIKPQNIMISTEGKVKVTDFGIARAASSNTISADVMGSVHYASPEQARNGYVDGRSDIYSLGIVMYEMVTGRVPFDGDTTVAVALQHLQEEMTPPSTYAPSLPISMEKIILKCTQKNPDRRYQTIEELLNDLRRSLVNPDEDFVVIAPLVDNGKTKVMNPDEIAQIKEQRGINSDIEDEDDTTKGAQDLEEDEDDEDDDEGGTMNPKLEKAINIMLAVVAVIIVIAIIYFALSIAGIFNSGSKTESESNANEVETETTATVEMVKIVGYSYEEALEMVEELGLVLAVGEIRESDEEDSTVLEQDIAPGYVVQTGTTVTVVIAGEVDNTIKMISVEGHTETAAKAELEAAGFLNVITEYEYNDEVDAGNVISQSLPEGSTATPDTEITLVISQGSEPTEVPTVTGKDEETAKSLLEEAGLNVSVKESYDSTVSEGIVISQSISGGKTVEQGTTVEITVSLGTEIAYYYCNQTIAIDYENVTKVDVVVRDSNNNILWSTYGYEITAGAKTFTVTKANIANTANAVIYVTFYGEVSTTSTYYDSYGVEMETETTTVSELGSNSVSVTFTKQNGYIDSGDE